VPGWKAYFRLAQTVTDLSLLDSWVARNRLRVVRCGNGGTDPTIYRELRALGASEVLAARTAANSRGLVADGAGRLEPHAANTYSLPWACCIL